MLAVTEQEMRESGNAVSTATIADLGEENGGGPMATLEMFHQLHCLVCRSTYKHLVDMLTSASEFAPKMDLCRLLQLQRPGMDI